MTNLAEFMIVVGAKNHPPMLDKTMYNSWESRMFLYIKGRKNGRMMLESIENRPLIYPTVKEDGQIRKKKYFELTEQEQLQDDCDSAKDIWERVKLLMKSLSYQERECKLYNEFEKFIYVKGETLHEYYLRFAQLINDMHTIGITMQQVQVNTKFWNALQPEWSKFMIDVKLAKNMYNTNYDQLYAYLSQHEGHENEVRMLRERYSDPLALGRQGQGYIGTGLKGIVIGSGVNQNSRNTTAGQARVVKCYNCQGEEHMARQCTQLKRPRNEAWFKEMLMLAEAHESCQVLDEDQLAFLADPRIAYSHVVQPIIIHHMC
ncbi:retrovirus-related pol polyprotein from transposon TNT 1-94 [Tanacetum coccineum]